MDKPSETGQNKKMTSDTKIVILTGAGVSAESGIKTFRDHNGLWENHDVLDVASPQGFERNPELVHQFYNQRRAQLLGPLIAPNPAHRALAELEKQIPNNITLITQNIDDLHERAGSQNLYHMHGELLKVRCEKTKKVFDYKNDLTVETLCPYCQESGHLRPHVVWFGERPLAMGEIEKCLHEADIFIAIGTSSQVYPAAMFVQIVKARKGTHAIEMNIEKTQASPDFDEHLYGPASEIVPKWCRDYLISLPKNTQS